MESGERLTITVHGHPVAELGPITDRPRFVGGNDFATGLSGLLDPADPLADELREADGPTTDPFG
ncbi:MAG: hypothetical protein KDB58_09520 [Solirubrobacterales bacterium]|nr:hypothetical protein [Solirubrobacterales bacterium]MCO5328010.1 hypothetical protein [Solirubrobacterales bacterium]